MSLAVLTTVRKIKTREATSSQSCPSNVALISPFGYFARSVVWYFAKLWHTPWSYHSTFHILTEQLPQHGGGVGGEGEHFTWKEGGGYARAAWKGWGQEGSRLEILQKLCMFIKNRHLYISCWFLTTFMFNNFVYSFNLFCCFSNE